MQTKFLFYLTIASTLLVSGCGTTTTSRNMNYSTTIPAEEIFTQKQTTDTYQEPPTQVTSTVPTTSTNSNSPTTTKPMEFNASKHYTAILHTTKGDIEIALNFGETPKTVKNFVDLARKNFYDKTIFHRAIKGFMIQGGDPQGNGSGGPGYRFEDEPFTGEYTRGTVAMANAGPNTNGSQFFIMHADYPLQKNYTIFGHVTKGLEVVDAIATDKVEMSPSGELSKPVSPTRVISVEINEK